MYLSNSLYNVCLIYLSMFAAYANFCFDAYTIKRDPLNMIVKRTWNACTSRNEHNVTTSECVCKID